MGLNRRCFSQSSVAKYQVLCVRARFGRPRVDLYLLQKVRKHGKTVCMLLRPCEVLLLHEIMSECDCIDSEDLLCSNRIHSMPRGFLVCNKSSTVSQTPTFEGTKIQPGLKIVKS
jgi:hypothetical protein